eukprot:11842311-Prorocentrum_lima.AAC.1
MILRRSERAPRPWRHAQGQATTSSATLGGNTCSQPHKAPKAEQVQALEEEVGAPCRTGKASCPQLPAPHDAKQ